MNKHISKAVSIILFVAMLLSSFSFMTVSISAAQKRLKAEGGYLFIEAEDLDFEESFGESEKRDYYSGREAIYPFYDNGTEPAKDAEPHLDLSFTADVAGNYSLWLRSTACQDNSTGNSVWLAAGEETYKSCNIGGFPDCPQWKKLVTIPVEKGQKGNLRLQVRQTACINLDCFIITNDEGFVPTDEALGLKSVPTPIPTTTPEPTPTPITYEPDPIIVKNGFYTEDIENLYYNEEDLELVGYRKASGKGVFQALKVDKNVPDINRAPSFDFSFIPDKNGVYTVWVYGTTSVVGDPGNNVFLSVNRGTYRYFDLISESGESDKLGWAKVATISASADKMSWIRIVTRQSWSLKFDKVLITDDPMYVPEGQVKTKPPKAEPFVTRIESFPFPEPTIVPPAEHPRLLFRASDIPQIKENMKTAEHSAPFAEFEKLKNEDFDGKLEQTGKLNVDGQKLGIIEAKAFDYAINGNEENGRAAIEAIKNYMDTVDYAGLSDATREMGMMLFAAAEVYDWCHPLLTEADKRKIVGECQVASIQMEVGFPPAGQAAIVGHGAEAQLLKDWLSLAIACYDEYPDMYNYVGSRFFSEYIEPRNYWFKTETQHQGSAYGPYRHYFDLMSQWIIYRMSGEIVYIPEAGKVSYQWIYTRRPDGQLLRDGDDYTEKSDRVNTWRSTEGMTLFLASNFYKDPVLKKLWLKENPGLETFYYAGDGYSPVQMLIINDPTIDISHSADFTELPLTKYFASPLGQMIARTGWNMGVKSPDVLAFMRIGELWASNHRHLDAGNFQIYYKGILASESGCYDSYGTAHDGWYNKSSIAHNTMLITSSANPEGVQRSPGGEPRWAGVWFGEGSNYFTGEMLAHEYGPDTFYPEYSYISGDIAKAYDENVKEAMRSMIFLPLEDENHPAAFVVFDKVTTKEADSKKAFVLHMQQEPTVEGNVSIIKNSTDLYNGMLTNQTLLPKNASIEKIGGEGKQFWVNGANQEHMIDMPVLEDGWGRIEISETGNNETDYFLNVMYVNDADKDLALEEAKLIESGNFVGARIFDRVVMFNKNKERTKTRVSFAVPGDGEVKVNVAGLEAGTWSVKVNGEDIGKQISSVDGGIIYFTAPAGMVEISYVGASADKTFTTSEAPYNEGVAVMLNGNYVYSDVAPTIRDGRTLLPMRAIFEALGANVSWDEATATATATTSEVTIKITENQTTTYVNDIATELDVPAMIIDGRFVVPVRFVSEALGANVTWDGITSLVTIRK